MDTGQTLLTMTLFGIMFNISPESAVGASGGAAFFLLHQNHHALAKRFAYAIISMLCGYAAGLGVNSEYSMLSALVVSAITVVSLDKLLNGINSDNPVPPILQFIVSLFKKH